MSNRRSMFFRVAALVLASTTLAAPLAHAQTWPTKPVRLIVPLTPGSGADIVARAVAKKLQATWGQTVQIENKPGAGGQIGTREVIGATDGHTLLVQSASHAVNPALYKSLPYDVTRDLVDVALLATTPYVMVTAGNGPYKNVKAIVDAAKAAPDGVPFASAGVGTSTHLTAELFAQAAGVKMIHIPFKGSPDAIQDVAGARSSFYMAPLPTVGGMLAGGNLAAIAVTSPQRVASLPAVPTLAESGYAGFSAQLWIGLWAPASMSADVVAKVAADVTAALQSDEVKEQYARTGNEARLMTPVEFSRFVRDEIETNKRLVRNAAIPLL
ncbi:Bug family tripartite tricarboxylate transporter substrate binding protein [Piscinibacter sakaiensis]|uniref:Bug family tripartite tricarboxylate transporter substrate binding protein n=1 Tax=Piscinibacter sakaiensis TaxID=1547922 RepID=UPI003AAB4918